MVGATLAFGIALLIEYLDDTVRSTEDASQLLALPVLGSIVQYGNKNQEYNQMLLTNFPSLSPITDGYRTIRTNLLYAVTEKNKLLIAVTSSSPQEGKTITTSNLAIALAQTGLQVLVIDADLRRPQIHRAFDLDNSVGLTTLLFADPLQHRLVDTTSMPPILSEAIQRTDIPRLSVMTSGFIPSNPTEILGSVIMRRWIDYLMRSAVFDVIIIDTPPILAAADTLVLTKNINAKTILVVDAGKTRRAAILRTKSQLEHLNVTLLGIVVNRINRRDEEYGYYNYYYSSTPTTPGSAENP
jgi:capsular exopolysaccharide synthesis family protein